MIQLLACGNHLYDHILDVYPAAFEVAVPSQERGRSCVCVLGLSYTSCFCDFPLDVRTKQYTENERLNNTNHTNNR